MKISSSPISRLSIVLAFSLVFGSVTFAVSAINTPESGYLLCVNTKTNVVTFPGTSKCPKGSTRLQLGAQGLAGTKGDTGDKGEKGDTGLPGVNGAQGAVGPIGLTGPAGANGINGLSGSSLLTGVGAPNNQLGNNGDTYIDKNGTLIYGPKSSGLWGNPTSFGGPAGPQGPKGETGANGATGPAGPATPATLVFISDRADQMPTSGSLPAYNGSNYSDVLTFAVVESGTYWVSAYTETYSSPNNQTSPIDSLCQIVKNGNSQVTSQNNSRHFLQISMALVANDVIKLRCASNVGGGRATNSSGYLLKVG